MIGEDLFGSNKLVLGDRGHPGQPQHFDDQPIHLRRSHRPGLLQPSNPRIAGRDHVPGHRRLLSHILLGPDPYRVGVKIHHLTEHLTTGALVMMIGQHRQISGGKDVVVEETLHVTPLGN